MCGVLAKDRSRATSQNPVEGLPDSLAVFVGIARREGVPRTRLAQAFTPSIELDERAIRVGSFEGFRPEGKTGHPRTSNRRLQGLLSE